MKVIVLGAGVVGEAAAWDLVRRQHHVTVADVSSKAAGRVANGLGVKAATLDVTSRHALAGSLAGNDLAISAVPYHHGVAIARVAVAAGVHYLDFGGNPTVVARQRELGPAATRAGVMVIPDCGLAPGIANVLAEDLIATADGPIDSVQIRVGALPQQPTGQLAYQLAFSPEGLINEYAEPCEALVDGRYVTIAPLTGIEQVAWEHWGPLEAFATAGGTSSLCRRHEGRVTELEYKTLRYPGHGAVMRALAELGMFDEIPRDVGGQRLAPRVMLVDALARGLPRGRSDVVLVRVSIRDRRSSRSIEIEDVNDERFSALARTTAFPATALAELIARGVVIDPGVRTMNEAVSGNDLLPELEPVGIVARERP
jgi:lysine 6-dehydrogenase